VTDRSGFASAPIEAARRLRSSPLPIAIYPVGLAVALVAELVNVGGVSPFAAIRSWVLVIAIALCLSIAGRVLLGDRDRGGVLAAIWVLALLGGDDPRFALVIIAVTVLMILERYALTPERRTIRWAWISRWGSRLAAVVALAVLIQAFQMGTLADAWRAVTRETPLRPQVGPAVAAGDPDIYLILLDGHTRADVLDDVFGLDERPFLDALEADGFSVATRSRSNYTNTSETLASMFNAAHLRDMPIMESLLAGTERRPAGGVVREAINDNPTIDLLRSRGYETEAILSGWEQVSMREADDVIDTGQINEFEIGVLRRSLVGHVLEAVAPDFVSSQQRDRINDVFAALRTAPTRLGERPRFIFAHVPSPHPPWVYNADGSPRTVVNLDSIYGETPASMALSNEELAEAYGGQVVDVDRRMLEALAPLDAAIDAAGRPSVVIIFSDHGTWIGADGGDIRLRFKNLLAIRSTATEIPLRPNETLVNLWPSVFSRVFGAASVRQPDTEYRIGARDNFDLVEVPDPDAAETR
jgi:Sulfatase